MELKKWHHLFWVAGFGISVIMGYVLGWFIVHQNVSLDAPTIVSTPAFITSTPALSITTLQAAELEVILDETTGTITITGFNAGDLWLGRVSGISMFPTMKDGGYTIIEKTNLSDVAVGDIIAFYDYLSGEYVAHRVSEVLLIDGVLSVNTLADNKNVPSGSSPQPYPITEENYLGKVRAYFDY